MRLERWTEAEEAESCGALVDYVKDLSVVYLGQWEGVYGEEW